MQSSVITTYRPPFKGQNKQHTQPSLYFSGEGDTVDLSRRKFLKQGSTIALSGFALPTFLSTFLSLFVGNEASAKGIDKKVEAMKTRITKLSEKGESTLYMRKGDWLKTIAEALLELRGQKTDKKAVLALIKKLIHKNGIDNPKSISIGEPIDVKPFLQKTFLVNMMMTRITEAANERGEASFHMQHGDNLSHLAEALLRLKNKDAKPTVTNIQNAVRTLAKVNKLRNPSLVPVHYSISYGSLSPYSQSHLNIHRMSASIRDGIEENLNSQLPIKSGYSIWLIAKGIEELYSEYNLKAPALKTIQKSLHQNLRTNSSKKTSRLIANSTYIEIASLLPKPLKEEIETLKFVRRIKNGKGKLKIEKGDSYWLIARSLTRLNPILNPNGDIQTFNRFVKALQKSNNNKALHPSASLNLQKFLNIKNNYFTAQPTVNNRKSGKRANITVVIDPGHGGNDPGSRGQNVKEKKLTLTISKKLKNELEKRGYKKVILTRSTDKFLPLTRRFYIAEKYKANVLVSIHADASKRSSARGITTYSRAQKKRKGRLLPLSKSQKSSYQLAKVVQQNLAKTTGTSGKRNRGARRARYAVLASKKVPSILVETGFISNKTDRKNLQSNRYQNKLVAGIANGLDDYFNV